MTARQELKEKIKQQISNIGYNQEGFSSMNNPNCQTVFQFS
jgi:DNA-binding LacI/PurR family transcriptional regulator